MTRINENVQLSRSWDRNAEITWQELTTRLKSPTLSPEVIPYQHLPRSIRMGTFHTRGRELLELSNADPDKRERMVVAKLDLDGRIVTPLATNAIVGEKNDPLTGRLTIKSKTFLERQLERTYIRQEFLTAYIHDHPLADGDTLPHPPSPVDIQSMIIKKPSGTLPLSLIYCDGRDNRGRTRSYVLLKTLETTEKTKEEGLEWAESVENQLRQKFTILSLRRMPDQSTEILAKTEGTKLLVQACEHHHVGLYVNFDNQQDIYIRHDLADLSF